MTFANRLGYSKFLYNQGKEYAEVFRGSLTGGAVLTFLASYFGLSRGASIAIGLMLIPLFVVLALACGHAVVRWRIYHGTIEQEWQANPYLKAHIDTLIEIRDRLPAPRQIGVGQAFSWLQPASSSPGS